MNKVFKMNAIKENEQRRPLVCTPLVGADRNALMAQLDMTVKKKPDMIEWRVDFFEDIHDTDLVVRVAEEINQRSAAIPILFTRRSEREGGEAIALNESQVFDVYKAVMEKGFVDAVDVELSSNQSDIERVKSLANEHDVKVLMSYHNFNQTPSQEEVFNKLAEAQRHGADIGKIAVMPSSVADVLTLMQATQRAAAELAIPVVTMSMGRLGALSRMMGGACGSAMTFAVGSESSAPGQIPIEQLETVLDVIENVMGK